MALEGEDFFDNQYYVYNRRFLTIVGLWPYQEPSKRLRYVYFMIVVSILAIILQTYILMKSEFDVKRIADLLQTYLPTICFALTYCNLVYNFAAMRETLDRVRTDWDKLTSEVELMMMEKYARANRSCCLVISCIFYIYITILICPSVSYFVLYVSGIIDDTHLTLPVNDEIFLVNKFSFFVIFSAELIMIISICTIGIAYYTILIAYAHHVYALFTILTIKIEQPFSKDPCKFDWTSSDTKRNDEFQWIVEIVKYHGGVINFIELIKLLFGGSYFMQVLLALLFIILDFFYFFQIIDLVVTTGEAITNSVYIIANLSMIYVAFYLGQKLIDHSIDVYTTCCLIPFYLLSIKTNNLLQLLIMRSSKPCEFSAGGIIVASHALFTKITRVSFSFATIFYNMR